MRGTPRVSAYIPCFDSAATVGSAIKALRAQTVTPAYIVVVDDGSSDGSADVARLEGAHVIRHARNLGRGAARAAGMAACDTTFVVCCDATNNLAPDFIERALEWFDDSAVAAVYGRIRGVSSRTAADRWRGRYLFREHQAMTVVRHASLITFGTVVRRAAVEAVGGFDVALRQCEDGELGNRLLAAGRDVVFDPTLRVDAVVRNTTPQVLERYWRWTAGDEAEVRLSAYARHVLYTWRHMLARDLSALDLPMALISGVVPHYCYWRSRRRLRSVRRAVERGH